jgi:molybdenum cofactor cytidylyltransferase
MIWAVVLAAGESRRMGTQKLLLPYRGTTVVESVVRAALDSSVDETLVVLGADASRIRQALRSYPLTFANNENYRLGMLSSVQAGFRALPAEAEAAIVMLGDQPAVPAAVVDGLVGAFRKRRCLIAVPVHGGRRGHPLLVGTAFRDEVLGLDPAVGLRELLRAHPEAVEEVAVDDATVLKDMDRPADYKKLGSRRR